ncbi:Gamma-aminobutyric acid receptor subunit alpha-6 [Halotydeus destructor]|nr:Gamma-aminobutyric acid receptor subunit alpha-6 [Halotydeus destructor]
MLLNLQALALNTSSFRCSVLYSLLLLSIVSSNCSKPPDLVRLQSGYVRTRATLSISKPPEARNIKINLQESPLPVKQNGTVENVRPVSPNQQAGNLDEHYDFASLNSNDDDEEEDETKAMQSEQAKDRQQLSFLEMHEPSRLIIKTEAIYPIEFEHIDQTGKKVVYSEHDGKKKGRKKKPTDATPSYKIQSRGSKTIGQFQFNATSTELKNDVSNITIVLEKLLLNYDSNQRPGHSEGTPALITSNIHIRSMGPMSELNNEYSLDCYFRQKWRDARLGFESNQPFLSLNINMLEKIWKPDTYFHNGKGSYLHTITRPNKFLRIYRNGDVYYSMRLTVKARCLMELRDFPMDKQSCPLLFGSYGYPNDQLRYQWDPKDPVSLNEELVMSQFDLINPIPYRNGSIYINKANFSILQVNFNLIRHTGYFLIQIYVPCALIVVLSWVSFWINREATADRVGLGITTVLTLSTFGMDTRTDLPKVSYPTALDWFVIMCFSFVSSTLLEFASVHYFTKIGFGEVPVIEMDDGQDEEDDSMAANYDRYNSTAMLKNCAARVRSKPANSAHAHGPLVTMGSGGAMLRPAAKSGQCDQYRYYGPSRLEDPLHIITPPGGFIATSTRSPSNVLRNRPLNVLNAASSDPVIDSKYFEATPAHHLAPFALPPRIIDGAHIYCPEHGLVEETNVDTVLSPGDHFVNYETGEAVDEDDPEYTDYDTEDCDDCLKEPTDAYIAGLNNGRHWTRCCWSNVAIKFPRCCRMTWHCLTGSEIYRKKMRRRAQGRGGVNSVSVIDKGSRILFPLSFALLNLFYWMSYGQDRNRPFETWKDGSPMFAQPAYIVNGTSLASL